MSGDTVTESLAAALVAAQADFEPIPRAHKATVPTKAGGSYSYTYADLADVVAMIRPVLAKHGLACVQDVTAVDGGVAVATRLVHTSGETMLFGPVWMPRGGTAQEMGSAVTYARRYSLTAALGIVTDDDDGGGAATSQAKPAPRKQTAKPTQASAVHGEPVGALEGERAALSRAMSAIKNDQWRHDTKAGFVERFGLPGDLPADRVGDAWAYVEDRLQSEPRVVV